MRRALRFAGTQVLVLIPFHLAGLALAEAEPRASRHPLGALGLALAWLALAFLAAVALGVLQGPGLGLDRRSYARWLLVAALLPAVVAAVLTVELGVGAAALVLGVPLLLPLAQGLGARSLGWRGAGLAAGGWLGMLAGWLVVGVVDKSEAGLAVALGLAALVDGLGAIGSASALLPAAGSSGGGREPGAGGAFREEPERPREGGPKAEGR